jgi:lactoylglutathione lyase
LRVHHIGIMVSDLERSIAWYQRVLGLKLADRRNLGQTQLAFLEAENTQIELIQDGGAYPGEGVVNHVAFVVDDIEAAVGRLRAAGAEPGDGQVRLIWGGGKVFFCEGPDGEVLELIQPGR